jgi:hypothetical protein
MKRYDQTQQPRMIGAAFFALSIWMSSCLPDPLPVDGIPVIQPQIVVSTQIIPDQYFAVLLTKTFGALEGSDESDPLELVQQIAVDDADVTITGPDSTYRLVNLGLGLYGGAFIYFEPRASYRLDVHSASLGSVTATTTVEPPITFDELITDLYYTGYDDTLLQVTHQFTDPVGKDYYMVNVQDLRREDLTANLINPRSFTRLIDDVDFEGQRHRESFRVAYRDYYVGDTTAIYLARISEEYYNFMKLRLDNRYSFVEYLSEPVNYPTNVVGGKGFFNLFVPDVRVIVVGSENSTQRDAARSFTR